jgi:tRNA threonylcarbamoyl adenosine modification protein (Sua5/YciO/YrdC/YwlC family)
MIDYVVEHNPDDRILKKASQILRSGGLLCFPTETNWVATCDPFNKIAVEKLYRLRHIHNTKHLSVLCASFSKATEIAYIDDHAFGLMKKVVPGPYTFIFEAQKKIQKYLKASKIDHQVGIRFPPNELSRHIINVFDDVLLSSHISHEMIEDSDPELPLYGALIEDHFGHLVDLILDPGETNFLGPTTIIDFTQAPPVVQRVGAGRPDLFL